jgi:hypothetical protein
MKPISFALAVVAAEALLLLCPSTARLSGPLSSSSSGPSLGSAPSSRLLLLRGAGRPDAASPSSSGSRALQIEPRPDEACYIAMPNPTNHNATTIPAQVPCTAKLRASCMDDPYPSYCWDSQADAANTGWLYCATTSWTVWTGGVVDCPWHYMCCDA